MEGECYLLWRRTGCNVLRAVLSTSGLYVFFKAQRRVNTCTRLWAWLRYEFIEIINV